jgi:AraC-like DNA-binding protein
MTAAASLGPAPGAALPGAAPAALLRFALDRARVRTNVCTLQHHRTGYTLAKRTVPDQNFIFMLAHKAVWVIEGERVKLSPGDLLLVGPGLWHEGFSVSPRVKLLSVHVEVTLPGGQDLFDTLVPPRVTRVTPDSPLERYLHGAAAEFERPDEADRTRMLASWGRLITLEYLRDTFAQNLLLHRAVDPLVAQTLDELRNRAHEPVTLTELSKWSGYSPQHLNRVFNAALGVTPLQHHARLRMTLAQELLADPSLTIAQVARRLGFDDAFYFSRLFKQHTSQSPAQHRATATTTEGLPPRPSPPEVRPPEGLPKRHPTSR